MLFTKFISNNEDKRDKDPGKQYPVKERTIKSKKRESETVPTIGAIENQNSTTQGRIKKKRRSEDSADQRTRTITFEPVKRHGYSEFIVRLSTMLYTNVNCGFRQVVKILDVVNDAFDGLLGKTPCHNTIENWVKKCGLTAYETAGASLQGAEYAQIVDESMMIGSEKLLVTLGVAAEHPQRPLSCKDVQVLDMAVAESWNGQDIGAQLKTAADKVGHNPLYVISDNASVISKGVRCSGFAHQRDISHSLGMFLERTYKNEADFQAYLKLMTEPKFKHNMKKIAYLLPPTQRTIARFMNLSGWVKWSSKMLCNYHALSEGERTVFSFVPQNASLIEELSEVVTCVNKIEHLCKNKGLSKQTVSECKQKIKEYLFNGNPRMIRLGALIYNFLTDQIKVVATDIAHNNSSDIVESLFGKYKARKSPDKLNGVTPFILFVPIYAKLNGAFQDRSFDFKAALEDKRMVHLESWKKENLTQNLVQLRSNRLKKSA